MKETTLCFVMDHNNVLLGLKKRGFGPGKWYGFGGKLEHGETPEKAAVREVREECSLIVSEKDLKAAGKIIFVFPFKPEWSMNVHVFVTRVWKGTPIETEEMKPRWFDFDEIPYSQMWDDYKHWFPYVLQGEPVNATFRFKEDNEHVDEFTIAEHNV